MCIYYTNTAIEEESNVMLTESRCHDRYQADYDYYGHINEDDDPADVFRTFSVTKLA